jgi:hypothetical protein
MRKKPLIETNPYLRDPEKRNILILKAVSTSTAIETKSFFAEALKAFQKSGEPLILHEPEATQKN